MPLLLGNLTDLHARGPAPQRSRPLAAPRVRGARPEHPRVGATFPRGDGRRPGHAAWDRQAPGGRLAVQEGRQSEAPLLGRGQLRLLSA